MSKRQILITAALPYANRPLHIGHLVEYLQADFWNRYHRLQGRESHYVCADDTHGTPVMIEARNRGLTPEQLIDNVWKEHTADFRDFQIEFSHYSSTNSPENRELCETFYAALKAGGHIKVEPVEQMYCNHDKMFLPDRFVKGTCPKCGALDQYGDNCDVCGATYSTTELKNPYCSLCRNTPVTKSSDHLKFQLEHFRDYLLKWLPEHTNKEMANKMQEWFKEPLRAWDISRDEPYFGFRIPGYNDKYFYVWVDAPMGYVSATLQLSKKSNLAFDDYWKSDQSEVYHFIGKDIVYFHTLFWPALLKAAGFRTPTQVCVHGMLTINGEKMSKSKGTQVSVRTYLNHLDPQLLRYYFASKINSSVDDYDWAEVDFTNRVNSDLVGKITNLGSRGAQMLKKKMDGKMSSPDAAGAKVLELVRMKAKDIEAHYEARDFSRVIDEVRALADETNRYFDERAPWKTLEADPAATKAVLTSTLNIFRALAIYLKPILPAYAAKVEKLFGEAPYTWNDLQKTLTNHAIADYEHLANRVDPEAVKAMMQASAPPPESQPAVAAPAPTKATTPAEPGQIEIDIFTQVDLRIGKIIEAEAIPEADKLLRLKVDLGPMGTRQIFAGIKSAYQAESLVGRLTVIVANLKPRKMKFGMSEGMVLAAGAGGSELFILSPDAGAKPGDKVK